MHRCNCKCPSYTCYPCKGPQDPYGNTGPTGEGDFTFFV